MTDTLIDKAGTEQGAQHYPRLKSKIERDHGKGLEGRQSNSTKARRREVG